MDAGDQKVALTPAGVPVQHQVLRAGSFGRDILRRQAVRIVQEDLTISL